MTMKALSFLLLCILLCASSETTAQDSYTWWDIEGLQFTEPVDCIRVSDTSFIVLSRTAETWPFPNTTYPIVSSYTIDGRLLWQVELEQASFSVNPQGIVPAPDNGWKILGTEYLSPGNTSTVRIHLDALGNYQGLHVLSSDTVPSIRQTIPLDNNWYAISSPHTGRPRIVVFSEDDQLQWQHEFEVPDPTIFYDMRKANDGVIAAGRAMPIDTNQNAYTVLTKLSVSGEEEWTKAYHSPLNEFNLGVLPLHDGTFITYGFQRKHRTVFTDQRIAVTRVNWHGDSLSSFYMDAASPFHMIQRRGGEILMSGHDQSFLPWIGHVTFGELPGADRIEAPETFAPVKLLEINDSTVVMLERRYTLTASQTSLSDLDTRVYVLKRQNVLSVQEHGNERKARIMDLR